MFPGVTLRQIEAFHWCVRLGSFSGAAARLNTTQPAISGRIRDLETLIGVDLFERHGRSTRLTATGRDLAEIAERFIALGDELVSRIHLQREFCGTIRLGAADSIALTWLPTLVQMLAERYPRLDVELVVDLSLNLQERLREGGIDLAFLVGGLAGPDYASRPIGALRNAWMCSPTLDLPQRAVDASELASFPVLTHSRGSHLHRMVEAWFERSGGRPRRLQGCNSLSTMVKMTVAGLGVSVLPPALLEREIADGELRVLSTTMPLPENVFVACWSTRPPAAITCTVVELAAGIAVADRRFQGSNMTV